jgi:hypothetical protein
LSNFSCIPSADLDNKTMSSAYIKQWIGELSKMTGSFVFGMPGEYSRFFSSLFQFLDNRTDLKERNANSSVVFFN